MKHPIKIKSSKWLPNSNTKMIHEDESGDLYLGPPIEATIDTIVIVEASDKPMDDGYYHITKVVGKANC